MSLLFAVMTLFYCCTTPAKNNEGKAYKIKLQWSGIGPDFGTGSISTDGEYLTDINWNTGNLKIINLETNITREIEGSGYEEGGYAWMSSFSNKGDQIAYEWYNYDSGTHELRLYSMESAENKILMQSSDSIYYWEPLDWTQHDDQILVAKQLVESNWEFGFVSPIDGKYRTIAQLDWNAPGGKHPFSYPNATLSPDDKYIGFDYRLESSISSDLYLVSVNTGAMTLLYESDGDDRFLAWSKDGQEVLFYSNNMGKTALYTLKVKDGKPSGKPHMILANIDGITPIGHTKKGFAFGKRSGDFNTYIAEIDVGTGEILRKPIAVDSALNRRNNVGEWSNDGKSLMFIRFYDLPSSRECVVIKSMENGAEIEIPFPWDFHNKTGTVKWISDNEILVDGNSPGYTGIHKFNLTNQTISIPANYGNVGFFQRFKANSTGSKIFVERRWQQPGIMSFETSTGNASDILEGAVVPTSLSIAPTDDTLAFLQDNNAVGTTSLLVMNIKTGLIKTVITEKKGVLRSPVVWLDSSQIITGVALSDEKKGLWVINLANEHDRVFIELPEVFGQASLAINKQGTHFAFQKGQGNGDLFFVDGF